LPQAGCEWVQFTATQISGRPMRLSGATPLPQRARATKPPRHSRTVALTGSRRGFHPCLNTSP
jgi:hypothetical protein